MVNLNREHRACLALRRRGPIFALVPLACHGILCKWKFCTSGVQVLKLTASAITKFTSTTNPASLSHLLRNVDVFISSDYYKDDAQILRTVHSLG